MAGANIRACHATDAPHGPVRPPFPPLPPPPAQYPFNVQDAIVKMADHVDLILIFFDPIGQATCKRTMEVVEKLNTGPHLEKIHYFM